MKRRRYARLTMAFGMAIYLTLPILRGEYVSPTTEFFLYQSYLRRFLATLIRGELPLWNPYVGSGYPAMYFGHYPIHQALLLYGLFGFDQTGFAVVKLCNLLVLFGGFLYAARRFRIPLIPAALGALLYLGIGFSFRFLISDTVSNSILFFPLVLLLLLEIVKDDFSRKRDLLLYFVCFVLWVTGVSITYLFMPFVILVMMYFLEARQARLGWKRAARGFFLLLVAPWVSVLYQIYFVYDVVIDSNRFKAGLRLSPLTAEPWAELLRSLASSSYVWMTLTLLGVASILRLRRSGWVKLPLFCGLALTWLLALHLPGADPISDYFTLLLSPSFWLAVFFFYRWIQWKKIRASLRGPVLFELFLLASLLSYYFYLPENVPGIGEPGYDYALFAELGLLARSLIDFVILLSVFADRWRRERRLAITGLIVTYLFRSHLSLPLMRFLNIVWYASRDGLIFSLFFSLLFLCGLFVLLRGIPARRARPAVCALLLLVLLHAVYKKTYFGVSHQYLFSRSASAARLDVTARVRKEMEAIRASEKGFFRIFSPTNSQVLLAGVFQDIGIYEAGLYESSIPDRMGSFYRNVILGLPAPKTYSLSESLPYGQFAKHVQSALGLNPNQIAYRDFYLYDPREDSYFRRGNVELWWDLAQVRYLLGTNSMARALAALPSASRYERIASYPQVDLYLYRIHREKPEASLALLLPRDGETTDDLLCALNSDEVPRLRALYSRLVFLQGLEASRPRNYQSSLEVEAPREGLLLQFESWNRHWHLQRDGEPGALYPAFHLFRAMKVHPGKNRIALEYTLPGFRALLALGFCFPFFFAWLVYRGDWWLAMLRPENLVAAVGSLKRRWRGYDFLEMRLALPEEEPPAPAFAPGIRLVGYSATHREACLSLLNRVGSLDYWNARRFEREILDRVDNPACDLFLLMDRALPCGFAALHGPRFSPCGLPELGYFAIDPSHRGRRLGERLLQAALGEAHRRGMREIFLRTDSFRLAAIVTYRRMGFRPMTRSEGERIRWEKVEASLSRRNRGGSDRIEEPG